MWKPGFRSLAHTSLTVAVLLALRAPVLAKSIVSLRHTMRAAKYESQPEKGDLYWRLGTPQASKHPDILPDDGVTW